MIYLDNNATTAAAPEVAKAMSAILDGHYGNPSSAYLIGQEAKQAVETARRQVGRLLGADPAEIAFTSGGTEADNWAIVGSLSARPEMKHIVTTRVEHEAIRNICSALEKTGVRVTWLDVDEDGSLDLDVLKRSLTKDTNVVSIMLANNETGILFPVREIAQIVRAHSDARFHVDAVNAAGKVPIDLKDANIDLLSISGHKFHGPKGVGALYIQKGVELGSYLIGGGQEFGRRAGTEAVHQIVGLGAAAAAASDLTPMAKVRKLRDRLEKAILDAIPNAYLNGTSDVAKRLPNTANISFENTNGEMILARLDDQGICVSTGSACNSGSHKASPVLEAMNVPYTRSMGSIRFSLGRYNTLDEVDLVSANLPHVIGELRQMAL